MSEAESETLLQFPCRFPLKVFGLNQSDFSPTVEQIVRSHLPEACPISITARPSKNGKYLALTLEFEASSKAQLDAIYLELSACQQVTMSL